MDVKLEFACGGNVPCLCLYSNVHLKSTSRSRGKKEIKTKVLAISRNERAGNSTIIEK